MFNLYKSKKKPNVFFDLGKVCNSNKILEEVNKVCTTYYEGPLVTNYKNIRKYFENDKLGENVKTIALITINGMDGEEGLSVLSGNRNINHNYAYTTPMKNSKILQDLIKNVEKKLNSKCFFSRIIKLKAGGWVGRHTDGPQFNQYKYRCHITLTKESPSIWMEINGDKYYMKRDYLYNTNVSFSHSTANYTDYDRINIIMDFFPSDVLLNMTS